MQVIELTVVHGNNDMSRIPGPKPITTLWTIEMTVGCSTTDVFHKVICTNLSDRIRSLSIVESSRGKGLCTMQVIEPAASCYSA